MNQKQRKDWEASPRYAMLMRRGVTDETEDSVDSFVDWLEDALLNEAYEKYEYTSAMLEEEVRERRQRIEENKELVRHIKALADAYLWRTPKVKQAELELLEKMKG